MVMLSLTNPNLTAYIQVRILDKSELPDGVSHGLGFTTVCTQING